MPCDDGQDGNVPFHDWTFEETLSAVVMVGEQLLVGRNASGAAHYLPLFWRTSNLLETRRDPATSYTTFLTGPSSNLLAPSFGGASVGDHYGGWAALAGVHVTYIAALDRMVECARLVGDTRAAGIFQARRALTVDGLALLTAPSPRPPSYFVRSRDPNGTLHGVLGQSQHGYFEASPNHDAVALRVVDDLQVQRIPLQHPARQPLLVRTYRCWCAPTKLHPLPLPELQTQSHTQYLYSIFTPKHA